VGAWSFRNRMAIIKLKADAMGKLIREHDETLNEVRD